MNKSFFSSLLTTRTLILGGIVTAAALAIVGTPRGLLSLNLNDADRAAAEEGGPITKKAFVLIYDPVMPDGRKLSAYKNWNNPLTMPQQVAAFFQQATSGKINYVITETKEIDGFPVKQDGFTYTPQSYLNMTAGNTPPHDPDGVNYHAILNDPTLDICGKLNRNEIDELWLYGGPWFGYNESALATSPDGPKGFAYNGPILDQTACARLMPVMGFNYERGIAEMIHNWGHRTEATMSQVYGDWQENRTSHNWDKFALVDEQSPNYTFSGCGSTHWPPNAASDYDYSNARSGNSFCDDFYGYPNLSEMNTVLKTITCSAWGCTQEGYLAWWFKHLPRYAGTAPDGKLNDWWEYIMDPNKALITETPGTFSTLSSNLRTSNATFAFSYSGSTNKYIIDLSTLPDMSSDVYLSFKEGRNIPLIAQDPQNMWDKYSCGRTLYWRVYNIDRTVTSPIQTAIVDCTATPSPSPTTTPTLSPSPSPTPSPFPGTSTPIPTLTPSPMPTAQPISYTFLPIADSYISQKNSSTNYGASVNLFVHKTNEGVGLQRAYLKFKVANVPKFVKAKLRLYLVDGSFDAPQLFRTSSSWSEKTLKWTNQPSLSAAVSNVKFASNNAWIEYDVISYVKSNATFSFGLAGEGSVTDGIIASSREGTHPAELVISVK
ncbi:MAG: DNRLRE domain-containing protein [bacterium]|nr:DNRLRE domain-containing protein [bacterium]